MKSETITLPRELTDNMAEAIALEANCCGGIADSIYEALIAAAPVDDGWVACSDRLPEDGLPVLILFNGEIRVGEIRLEHPSHEETFQPFRYWDCPYNDGQAWEVFDITHWRPLPPPPMKKDPE